MKLALPFALTLLCACDHKHAAPSPTPAAPEEKKPEEKKPVEIPAGWSSSGDLEKGISLENAPVRATLRLVKRPAPFDRDAWGKYPRTLASDTDSAGIEDKRLTVDRRDAWRVQYRYRELGRGATHPFDRRAVEVFVQKDANSCYELVFQFADKDSDAALPKIDGLLAELRIRE